MDIPIHADQPPPALVHFCYAIDASLQWIAPYIDGDATDRQVQHLIDMIARRQPDATAYNHQAQISRLPAGPDRPRVAAVGTFVAQTLRTYRIRMDLMPDDRFFLKPLTQKPGDYFGTYPTPQGRTTRM